MRKTSIFLVILVLISTGCATIQRKPVDVWSSSDYVIAKHLKTAIKLAKITVSNKLVIDALDAVMNGTDDILVARLVDIVVIQYPEHRKNIEIFGLLFESVVAETIESQYFDRVRHIIRLVRKGK